MKFLYSSDYWEGGKAGETCQSSQDNEDIQASETLRGPSVSHLHITPGTDNVLQHTLFCHLNHN